VSCHTAFTHDELVEIGRKWLLKPWRNASRGGYGHGACGLVTTEIITSACESPDVLGWSGNVSILLEAKVSRADFRADRKKIFRKMPEFGIGHQRYYIAPSGMISVDELPEGWGLIEVNDKGKTLVKLNSERFQSSSQLEVTILLSLIRRLKVAPGRHVSIRAYTIDGPNEPKATVTFNKEEQ